jgi:putative sigma-54 modulation protein
MPNSESMSSIITEKLNKLGKKYDWIIKAEVHYKKENDPTGKGKICEIMLSAPGPRLFAKSNQDDYEKASATAIKELESQLKKRKEIFNKY